VAVAAPLVTVPERFRGLWLALDRVGLAAWFIAVDLLWVAKPEVLGIDARHYQRAASTWLAGGDPWTVTESGITFAAGPHTLLFYAPTSLLTLDVAVATWLLLGAAASLWLVRRLDLPLWWFLFPPLLHAVWNGNSQSVALALLVLGGPLGAVAAVGLKLYAAVPLLARPRLLIVAGVALAVTLPFLPWQLYLEGGFGVSDHLQTAWNGSAWRLPILLPPTLLALWILRRHGAEWLAVPAAWPATQFYYSGMALPALAGRRLLAGLFALPAPLVPPLVVIGWAGWMVWTTRRGTRVAESAEPLPAR
jgi:hypothetical protein